MFKKVFYYVIHFVTFFRIFFNVDKNFKGNYKIVAYLNKYFFIKLASLILYTAPKHEKVRCLLFCVTWFILYFNILKLYAIIRINLKNVT